MKKQDYEVTVLGWAIGIFLGGILLFELVGRLMRFLGAYWPYLAVGFGIIVLALRFLGRIAELFEETKSMKEKLQDFDDRIRRLWHEFQRLEQLIPELKNQQTGHQRQLHALAERLSSITERQKEDMQRAPTQLQEAIKKLTGGTER